MELREALGDLGDGGARLLCCGAGVDDECVERELPVVVASPPVQLAFEVGVEAASKGSWSQEDVLGFVVVVSAAEADLGQQSGPEVLVVEGVVSGEPAEVEHVDGQVEEDLSGERVVLGVQLGEVAVELVEVNVVGEAGQEDGHGLAGTFFGGLGLLVDPAIVGPRVTAFEAEVLDVCRARFADRNPFRPNSTARAAWSGSIRSTAIATQPAERNRFKRGGRPSPQAALDQLRQPCPFFCASTREALAFRTQKGSTEPEPSATPTPASGDGRFLHADANPSCTSARGLCKRSLEEVRSGNEVDIDWVVDPGFSLPPGSERLRDPTGGTRRSVEQFWGVSDGQLYPQLHHLSGLGLIEQVKSNPSSVTGAAITWSLTEEGRSALLDWLRSPSAPTHTTRTSSSSCSPTSWAPTACWICSRAAGLVPRSTRPGGRGRARSAPAR